MRNIHEIDSEQDQTAVCACSYDLWKLSVYNELVRDPTMRKQGFDLFRRPWSLLNHFRTGQVRCLYNLHKWGLAPSDLCVCGEQQTMSQQCPLMKFGGRMHSLHEAGDDAIRRLEFEMESSLCMAQVACT